LFLAKPFTSKTFVLCFSMAPYTRSTHKRQIQTLGGLYTPIFKLKKNSLLKEYLAKHIQDQLPNIFKLTTLLTKLKNIIYDTHQFDENNPSIFLFDNELNVALDVPALHYDQLYKFVHKHLKHIITLQPRLTLDTKWAINMYPTEPKPNIHIYNTPTFKSPYIVLFTNSPAINPIVPPNDKICFALENDLCVMKKKLRLVLDGMPDFPKQEFIFTFQDIQKYVTSYVMYKKYFLVDPRNPVIYITKNDPLGDALNVKAFHIAQLENLIRLNITILKF
jgi:hypothetical protein